MISKIHSGLWQMAVKIKKMTCFKPVDGVFVITVMRRIYFYDNISERFCTCLTPFLEGLNWIDKLSLSMNW